MSLEDLATELVEFIAGHLQLSRHLNAFCQTNRRFYAMFNERLYRRDVQGRRRALTWGAWKGILPTVERALKQGADVNVVNNHVVDDCDYKLYAEETPIFMAVRNRDFDVVRLLLSKGADVHRRNRRGDNIVICAVSTGDIDMVRLVLAEGVDVNSHQNGDVPPLLLAARRGYTEIVKALLDQGAKVGDKDSWGETPLQVAVTGGQHDILKIFLDRHFIRDEPMGDIGADALEVAIVRKDFLTLKLLLEGGANPLAKRRTGYNAIISAILSRQEDMAIFMTEALENIPEVKDRVGKGLLWYAANGNCEGYAKYLLDRNVDPNTDIWQPLTGAMYGASCKLVEMLLDRGADIEFKDEMGRTPLKVALEEGGETTRKEVVSLLVRRGASLRKAKLNAEQKTYVERCLTCGH
ncbi:ankyrin protein [Fusarium heterosporum]|uniref:Ankyrin protein n=1 Tax=Fusarium heterosporum TaxID=42747 RepID=A0A8H5TCM1_FUSHE|nr:ankyrin protein [Fusarium heterosporum]